MNTKFAEYLEFRQSLDWFSGYITEPKIDYTESGKSKTTFAIPLKKKKEDEAIFLNCVLWNNEKFVEQYKKGDNITVGGYFVENEYKGKNYINFIVKIVY